MIRVVSDEVPEDQATPEIAAGYARIRGLLGSTFVPTVYRRLAPYPDAFALAVDRLAAVVDLGNTSGFPEKARSLAVAALPARAQGQGPRAAGVSKAIGRYRAANPTNLLFSLAISSPTTTWQPGVMAPPLPPPCADIWQDIRGCHGGPIVPGLWRDLAPWPDELRQLWRQTRLAADGGDILAARQPVLAAAQDLLSDAGLGTRDGGVLDSLPPDAAMEFSWFPVGVASMIAEGEFLDQLTNSPHTHNGRIAHEPA
ncbi:MAG: hypothetical protein Q8M17_12495 [Actinomycetota bacterium]|nr:hypothetical protein [Actinomycetota bacterium]